MTRPPTNEKPQLAPDKDRAALDLAAVLFNKGLELLARREHSQYELRTKLQSFLQRKQLAGRLEAEWSQRTDQDIDKALAKLSDQGLQSDERFTEAFCRSRLRKGFGRKRVLLELGHKGIDHAMAEDAFEEASLSDFAPDEVIYRTWQKKFRALAATPKEQAKQYRFLQYRGFNGQQISALFSRLQSEAKESGSRLA